MQIPSQKLRIPVEELQHWDRAQEKKKKRHVEEGRKDHWHYPITPPWSLAILALRKTPSPWRRLKWAPDLNCRHQCWPIPASAGSSGPRQLPWPRWHPWPQLTSWHQTLDKLLRIQSLCPPYHLPAPLAPSGSCSGRLPAGSHKPGFWFTLGPDGSHGPRQLPSYQAPRKL